MDGEIKYLLVAANHSKYNGKQWLRYLRKEFDGQKILLTRDQISYLLFSEGLTMFQKIALKRTMEHNSETNKYVSGLNYKIKLTMIKQLMSHKYKMKEKPKKSYSDIDICIRLETFGIAYGMDWLEKYYIENEEEIIKEIKGTLQG